MVNGLQQRGNSGRQQRRGSVDRRWLSIRYPAVRHGLHVGFGLGHGGGVRYRSPSDLLANRLWVPKNRRNKLLIGRGAVAHRPRNFRVKELLGVLPNLGCVCAKREPQSDEIRLEVTVA